MVAAASWESLAGAARSGDQGATNALLRSVQPYLRRLAGAVRGPDEDDLTQIGLLAVWRGLDRYDPARPFKEWARVVAKNAMLGALRRHRAAVGFADGCGFDVTEGPPADSPAADLPPWWVWAVMEGLDDRERAAVGERFGLVGSRPRTGAEVAAGQGRCRQRAAAGVSESLAAMRVAFEVRYGGLAS